MAKTTYRVTLLWTSAKIFEVTGPEGLDPAEIKKAFEAVEFCSGVPDITGIWAHEAVRDISRIALVHSAHEVIGASVGVVHHG